MPTTCSAFQMIYLCLPLNYMETKLIGYMKPYELDLYNEATLHLGKMQSGMQAYDDSRKPG